MVALRTTSLVEGEPSFKFLLKLKLKGTLEAKNAKETIKFWRNAKSRSFYLEVRTTLMMEAGLSFEFLLKLN